MKFETKAIRLQTERTQYNEHSTPLFATSSFVFDSAESMRDIFAGEESGNIYSRFSNPTVREFELKMAALEGGEDAMATASGMSAIFTCFASFLSSGDHVVMSKAVFGSTIKIFENYFSKWGVTCDLVDPTEDGAWEKAITSKTKIVYIETPSNPGLTVIDISKLSTLCKEHDALLVVDNCFATPYIQQPLTLGADIAIHSATKYIDGQGRVLGGVLVSTTEIITEMMSFLRNAGPTLSAFNAWIMTKSLETLAIRMERHSSNALKMAEILSDHPKVTRVNYPFLKDHPGYDVAKQQMILGGGMLSFELSGGLSHGVSFLNAIETLSLSANLGDTRSIVTHSASTTHSKLTEEQRLEVGITPGLIRMSVGIEHIDDIVKDVLRAIG